MCEDKKIELEKILEATGKFQRQISEIQDDMYDLINKIQDKIEDINEIAAGAEQEVFQKFFDIGMMPGARLTVDKIDDEFVVVGMNGRGFVVKGKLDKEIQVPVERHLKVIERFHVLDNHVMRNQKLEEIVQVQEVKKHKLLETLRQINQKYSDSDIEMTSHEKIDRALLEYFDDPEITAEYEKNTKWYE